MKIRAAESLIDRVTILGLGYIGLPTALVLLESGFSVHGVDIDEERLRKIQTGEIEILDSDLVPLLKKALKNRKFTLSSSVSAANYFIIAVPTPILEFKADLRAVFSAVRMIATVMQPRSVVILESTVPVGTTEKIGEELGRLTGLVPGSDFFVAHAPERILPGRVFEELIFNKRVIGGLNKESARLAKKLYQSFVKGEIYLTDLKTAEMTKLVENSYRDLQLAFANQIAMISEELRLDTYKIIELANHHPRVSILNPGPGVGGHCVAVDPWFLINSVSAAPLLKAARLLNDDRPNQIIRQVIKKIELFKNRTDKRPNLLLLGITYKENIPDLRSSPSLAIARALAKINSCSLSIVDPIIGERQIDDLSIHSSWQKKISAADIIVLLVKHHDFLLITEKDIKNKEIVDPTGTLNFYPKKEESNETTIH